MDRDRILRRAREVLNIEATGILSLRDRLDQNFIQAVDLLFGCRGKVVVMGLGKSGHVCRKIAATLASTGTPSFFLHAGDGVHGDVGMIMEGDVIRTIRNNHQWFGHYHTGGNPGRNEIDETQELYYPAITRAVLATGFQGYYAHEFIPKNKDPLKSLRAAVALCDVS